MKAYLEQAIKGIEAEKNQQLNVIKTRVMQEKIVPYNVEADKERDLEISDLTVSYNKAVQELQSKFVAEKQSIIDKYEQKKADNMTTVLEAETFIVANKYDTQLTKLREQLGSIEE